MENYKPKHNDFVVLKINEKCDEKILIGYEAVYWINNEFPLNQFYAVLEMGYFDVREATEIEKEYCYSCYDTKEHTGVDLDDMYRWLEWKENQKGCKHG